MVQMIFAGGPVEDDELEGAEGTTADAAESPWDALSLDNLKVYEQDLDAANALLDGDGWTKAEDGSAYAPGEGSVRYKEGEDGERIPLTVRFANQLDNPAADLMIQKLMAPMAELGVNLEMIELNFTDLLDQYYRNRPREFHATFLATNFSSVFDPYFVFSTEEAMQGLMNTSGLMDEELAQAALDLRRTEPGDLLGYCQKWVAFQQLFDEKLPMIPLYSNVYYDFSIPTLQGYNPNKEATWPSALLYAHIGEDETLVEGEESADEDGGEEDPGRR